jgi:hypothetical protein
MLNLRKIPGTLKGDVGEAIFLALNKYAHGTKFDSYSWLYKVPFAIPEKFVLFLQENWATIDAFEFHVSNNIATNITFYEIKTVNYYTTGGINFGNKPFITKSAAEFYTKALKMKCFVKSALVILHNNWDFELKISDYNQDEFKIHDGNPLYSKKIT